MAATKSDLVGMTLSAACIVHCLLLPVMVLAAPAWNAWLGETENALHWIMFGVALVVSGYAFFTGYRRHRAANVIVIGAAGLVVMLAAALHLAGPSAEAALTVSGALVVALAHVQNVRLGARRDQCCTAEGSGPDQRHSEHVPTTSTGSSPV